MSEIRENTLWNEFDMCRIGDLRDPQTQEPIRKRMTVCSTSVDLHLALHGKLCSGEHHHRPIAGNTHVDGRCVKLSQWTELYPQKFARQVAKVLIHESSNPQLSFAGDVEEHPTKKRRLGGKMSPEAIAARFSQSSRVSWQQAMQVADHSAPRVGTLVIDAGELIQVVQQLCPEKKIHHVVLCRGTDRYVGPNKSMLPGLAPLRRQICIRRHSTEIHVDDWEQWERLSQKKLRRKGVPARVSMTVFAAPAQSTGVPNTMSHDARESSADASNPESRSSEHSLERSPGEEPISKRMRVRERESRMNQVRTMTRSPIPLQKITIITTMTM